MLMRKGQHRQSILHSIHLTKNSKYHIINTVKPVLNGHSKIGKTKILMTKGTLMKVESIAKCSRILLTCIKRYVLKTTFWSSFRVAI